MGSLLWRAGSQWEAGTSTQGSSSGKHVCGLKTITGGHYKSSGDLAHSLESKRASALDSSYRLYCYCQAAAPAVVVAVVATVDYVVLLFLLLLW